MAKTDTASARAPRGTRVVSQAFFTALDAVPEASRSAVAKAAQAMIRDEMKGRRDKAKATAAKEKARRPVAAKQAGKKAEPQPANDATPAQPKRRSKKQSDVPVAA